MRVFLCVGGGLGGGGGIAAREGLLSLKSGSWWGFRVEWC
jgi:hypothetical protein